MNLSLMGKNYSYLLQQRQEVKIDNDHDICFLSIDSDLNC